MKIPRSYAFFWLSTIAAALIGAHFRWQACCDPLWIDELHTAWSIDASFGDVARRAGMGNQTPLYFWISWLASQSFGQSEWILRLPSLFFSVATIVLAAMLVHRCYGHAIACATTALWMSTDPWFVFYGSEARPYAMLQCLSVVQVACLMRVCRQTIPADTNSGNWRGPDWPLLLTTAMLIATHLTSLLLVAAEALFALCCLRVQQRQRTLFSLIASLAVIPWLLPTLSTAFQNRMDWQSVSGIGQLVADSWLALISCVAIPVAAIVSMRFLGGRFVQGAADLAPQVPEIAAMRFPGGSFAAESETVNRLPILVTLFWSFGPLIIVIGLTAGGLLPMAAYRYTLAGSVGFPVVAGLLVARMRNVSCSAMISAAILLTAAALNPMLRPGVLFGDTVAFRNEDWKSVVAELQRPVPDGKPLVFLFPNLVEDHRLNVDEPNPVLEEYLRFPLGGIYRLPQAVVIPLPTLTSKRWTDAHLDRIVEHREARIVARVTETQMQAIVHELQSLAKTANIELIVEIKTQPNNILRIGSITLDPKVVSGQ